MSYERIMNHPILGEWSEQIGITFRLDDQEYEAFEGETIAAALLANGIRTLRYHEDTGTPRAFIATSDTASNAALRLTG